MSQKILATFSFNRPVESNFIRALTFVALLLTEYSEEETVTNCYSKFILVRLLRVLTVFQMNDWETLHYAFSQYFIFLCSIYFLFHLLP